MTKILSQAGQSLADMYDVQGSVAGIEQLETRELPIVHEMGGTVFSERFSSEIFRATSGAIAQNTNFDTVLTGLPELPFRIFGAMVWIDVTTRISLASIAIREPTVGREMVIWAWDAAADLEVPVRLQDEGGAVTTRQMLRPVQLLESLPHMTAGRGQPRAVPEIAFRGLSSGFGAGTVTAVVLLHVGFSRLGGVSSRGLPIPSW